MQKKTFPIDKPVKTMAMAQPATTQHSVENSPVTTKLSLPELSVVLFNVHSSDRRVKAADRQNCLGEVLDSVLSEDFPDPLFVLCQEKINGPKHRIVCQKLGQDLETVPQNTEATIYYREPAGQYEVRYIDVSTLQRTDNKIPLEPNVSFEKARLMACILTTPEPPWEKILLLSWHGPETRLRKNTNRKVACFHRLVRFSERLRRDESCDVVLIGGDFNLPTQKVREVMDTFRRDRVVDGAVSDQYVPPSDRKTLSIKDFIVYWPQNRLQNIQTSVILPEYRRKKGNRPFDHPIVGFKFRRVSVYEHVYRQCVCNASSINLPDEASAQAHGRGTSNQPEE